MTYAELWPNIFYVLLFWQLANEITEVEEAKRFYSLFSLFGNSSLILVGLLISSLSKFFTSNALILNEQKVSLIQASIILIILMGFVSVLMVNYIFRNVITDPSLYLKAKLERTTTSELGFIESFKIIVSSRYLWLILICTAAFGLTMNLIEAVWKAKTVELYSTLNEFAEINSFYIIWTGIVIMFMTIIGNNIMRRYSWLTAALITPIIILVTGTVFFILAIFNTKFLWLSHMLSSASILSFAVSVGAIQNILSKATKYSVWDTSREILYIPLNQELKTKGKAAVDIISSKVGKSLSGFIQVILFTTYPTATYDTISPFLLIIFFFCCLLWIYAICCISKEYQKIA